MFQKMALTVNQAALTHRSMGRPPQHMREIKVQFPEEMIEEIDALVGNKHRSKFIRTAVAGVLTAAKQIKTPGADEDK